MIDLHGGMLASAKSSPGAGADAKGLEFPNTNENGLKGEDGTGGLAEAAAGGAGAAGVVAAAAAAVCGELAKGEALPNTKENGLKGTAPLLPAAAIASSVII